MLLRDFFVTNSLECLAFEPDFETWVKLRPPLSIQKTDRTLEFYMEYDPWNPLEP